MQPTASVTASASAAKVYGKANQINHYNPNINALLKNCKKKGDIVRHKVSLM